MITFIYANTLWPSSYTYLLHKLIVSSNQKLKQTNVTKGIRCLLRPLHFAAWAKKAPKICWLKQYSLPCITSYSLSPHNACLCKQCLLRLVVLSRGGKVLLNNRRCKLIWNLKNSCFTGSPCPSWTQ